MRRIIIAVLLLTSLTTQAQKTPNLVHRGKIKWERKMNMYSYIDDMSKSGNSGFLEQAKKRIDKYKVDKFVQDFSKVESLYQPEKDGIQELKMPWINISSEVNEVYNNFKTQQLIASKEIYDKRILIKDSLKDFKWRIKEEFRTIAGYNCRRAETIIMDSVWVVAFYSDAIIASGGPESFNGLPGMILGLVMPRLNVTYFATEVQPYTDARRELKPPTKGKEYTNESFTEYLRSNMKRWGGYLQRILWYATI
jgi:GLPGLI family protein